MDKESKESRDILSQLAHLRDDFSDEVSSEMITSISPDNMFMVRKGWWQGVIASLHNALSENLIPDKHKGDAERFLEEETERLSKEAKRDPRKRTTAQDIERAKNILDKVLGR